MDRKIALRALRNLCTFFGAIALFSYFFNWAIDLRHWYVTLGSALICSILWLGFYVMEARGGMTQLGLEIARFWSKTIEAPKTASAAGSSPATAEVTPVAADLAVAGNQDAGETPAPNPLPWLRPAPPLKKAAGKP